MVAVDGISFNTKKYAAIKARAKNIKRDVDFKPIFQIWNFLTFFNNFMDFSRLVRCSIPAAQGYI